MAPMLEDFIGRWRVRRRIRQADGVIARFEGGACFTPDGTGLAYVESGLLQLAGGARLAAERRYLWRAEGREAIAILFEDGRPFHRLELCARAPADRHLCPPDLYEVRYDFGGWPCWRTIWEVRGPRKDYVMSSCYEPEP